MKKSLIAAVTLCTIFTSSLSLAKMLNLYDQDNIDAKVIGTLDSVDGMVPIFTAKDGNWMKVGDPKNGNVGWIKTKDFSNDSGSMSTSLSVSQKTVTTPEGTKTFPLIQFGTLKPVSPEKSEAIIKEAQKRQKQLQDSVQKLMQGFYKQMNDYYKSNPAVFNDPSSNFPMFMPIIVFPVPESAPPVVNTPPVKK